MEKTSWHFGKEFRKLLPALIFFLIAFHMLSASKSLILKQHGIIVPASTMATISALIMAKVVFLMDRLRFLNTYPRKPLIYDVAAKTAAFSIASVILFIVEELIRGSIKTGSVAAGWAMIAGEVNWSAFWLRQVWFSLLIFLYCLTVEFAKVIGPDKVREIFLGIVKK